MLPLIQSTSPNTAVGTSFTLAVAGSTDYLPNATVNVYGIQPIPSWNPEYFFLSPGSWNEDLSVFKYFEIKERLKVRFTADFFNAFNHPINYLPGSLGGDSGTSTLNTTTGLLDLSRQVNDPRIIQFFLRVEF